MSKKFLVYKHAMFYSTHGEIQAMQTYDAFINDGLSESFMITGFMDNTASFAHITNICPINLCKYNSIHVYGKGITPFNIFVYPKQEFMNSEGIVLEMKDIIPDTLLISLNGSLCAEYVETLKDDEKEFYMIETEEDVPNIYCDTIITLPYKEEEKPNFFAKQKKKSAK